MLLSPEQVAEADKLGLSYLEMSTALRMHIDPAVYLRHKNEIAAERAKWDAKMAELELWAVENAPQGPDADADAGE